MTLFYTDILAMMGFSGWELGILLVLGLLVFGRRLPELGRSVGRTIVEFKKGLSGIESDVNNSATPPAEKNSNSNGNAALPSNQYSNQANPQSSDGSNPYAQNQNRPPQS